MPAQFIDFVKTQETVEVEGRARHDIGLGKPRPHARKQEIASVKLVILTNSGNNLLGLINKLNLANSN